MQNRMRKIQWKFLLLIKSRRGLQGLGMLRNFYYIDQFFGSDILSTDSRNIKNDSQIIFS
jgi:hypothetical protein